MQLQIPKHYVGWLSLLVFVSPLSLAKEWPEVAVSGTAMVDYSRFDPQFIEDGTASDQELDWRKLRFRLKTQFAQNWEAKLSLDVHKSGQIKDAYIKYNMNDALTIIMGQQKEPFSMQNLQSSKNLVNLERSISTEALAPSRGVGISVLGNRDRAHWHLGYFQDDNAQNSTAVTGRLAWAPWYHKKNLLHVGMSFSQRDLNGAEFRINENLEVYAADSLFEGTRIATDAISLQGLEFAWQYHGVVLSSEWQMSQVTATNDTEYEYEGGYFQLSYLFSGENRKYKNGVLDDVKLKNNWEVFLRQSQLTLVNENKEASIVSAGVNYYATKNLKLKAEMVRAQTTDNNIDSAVGNAVNVRLEYSF